MKAALLRVRDGLHAILVALDQLAFTVLCLPAWAINQGDRPSPYETISSAVGRQANFGWAWARYVQWEIDHLFSLLGSPAGHCQRSIVRSDWIAATLP